jgi:hypothetical protein
MPHDVIDNQSETLAQQTSNLHGQRRAREETLSLTGEAVRVEREIDERVKALYGI